jgi:iron complex outermembrane receptor protein
MVTVNFEPNEDILLYGKVSQGFKSGGFDIKAADPGFDPEHVTAYQLGAKTTMLDGALQIDTEAFYYDHSDLQVNTIQVIPGSFRADEVTENGGDSKDYGAEIEATLALSDNFIVRAGVGYVHSEYGEYMTLDPMSDTNVNLKGNSLINSPEWSTNLMAQYSIPTDAGTFYARGEYQWKDEYYMTQFNHEDLKQDAYSVINARLGFTTENDQFEIAIWGRNLGDELYYVQKTDLRDGATGAIMNTPAAPRTYGIELIANF